ncbi:unnamed protein product [Zymoseptoria tritici ST99CH_1E4]|uniref:Myb-like domain-containing protein n=1 Tax=Zymoseptoria tritici ST99CH_1E4 TaxID=1276532 RepID=A0A2H1GNI6_ZYMTR|nr:unnamed protein product [Zymoseptoria tritici ST99CH_1E4]
MNEERLPWKAIAAHLQLPVDAIQWTYQKIVPPTKRASGVPRSDALTPEESLMILGMVRQQSPRSDIYARLPERTTAGVDAHIKMTRRMLGIPSKRGRLLNKVEVAELMKLREGGLDWARLKKHFPKLSIQQLEDRHRNELKQRSFNAKMTALLKERSASSPED